VRLGDLVANGSLEPAGADLLRAIGAGGHSFLVHALPRNAGKTTVTEAILAEAPSTSVRHDFLGSEAETEALLARPSGGEYLAVAEMGHRGRPGYLAGEEIVRAFDLAAHGYTLVSSLHADTVEQVVETFRSNGVDAATIAANVRYLVQVRVLGDDPFASDVRRRVERVHELAVDEVAGCRATVRYEVTDTP
jgi:hypothetical protein